MFQLYEESEGKRQKKVLFREAEEGEASTTTRTLHETQTKQHSEHSASELYSADGEYQETSDILNIEKGMRVQARFTKEY
ncbi:hypothetical protein NLI96_g1157 [Meripilus lineatus]|uniref:Uncharacterized protein n=1 Tax=Meripilus lineatus TaxID=2056292 RepID=A0AAD5VFD7_9APHY|nr:hypothetical protein NLI96_g1157 [Physisporinus lineatus]